MSRLEAFKLSVTLAYASNEVLYREWVLDSAEVRQKVGDFVQNTLPCDFHGHTIACKDMHVVMFALLFLSYRFCFVFWDTSPLQLSRLWSWEHPNEYFKWRITRMPANAVPRRYHSSQHELSDPCVPSSPPIMAPCPPTFSWSLRYGRLFLLPPTEVLHPSMFNRDLRYAQLPELHPYSSLIAFSQGWPAPRNFPLAPIRPPSKGSPHTAVLTMNNLLAALVWVAAHCLHQVQILISLAHNLSMHMMCTQG